MGGLVFLSGTRIEPALTGTIAITLLDTEASNEFKPTVPDLTKKNQLLYSITGAIVCECFQLRLIQAFIARIALIMRIINIVRIS